MHWPEPAKSVEDVKQCWSLMKTRPVPDSRIHFFLCFLSCLSMKQFFWNELNIVVRRMLNVGFRLWWIPLWTLLFKNWNFKTFLLGTGSCQEFSTLNNRCGGESVWVQISSTENLTRITLSSTSSTTGESLLKTFHFIWKHSLRPNIVSSVLE